MNFYQILNVLSSNVLKNFRVFLFYKQIFCGLNTCLQLSKATASQSDIFVQREKVLTLSSWLGSISSYGHIVAWWIEHWLDLSPHTQPQLAPLWAVPSIHGSSEITLFCVVIIYILTFTKIFSFSLEILSFQKKHLWPIDGLPFNFKSFVAKTSALHILGLTKKTAPKRRQS